MRRCDSDRLTDQARQGSKQAQGKARQAGGSVSIRMRVRKNSCVSVDGNITSYSNSNFFSDDDFTD